jgi:hypothetical protein
MTYTKSIVTSKRIATIRAALVDKYGPRNHRITGHTGWQEVHVYSQMPNSIETGWWLLGDLDFAEWYLDLTDFGFSEVEDEAVFGYWNDEPPRSEIN